MSRSKNIEAVLVFFILCLAVVSLYGEIASAVPMEEVAGAAPMEKVTGAVPMEKVAGAVPTEKVAGAAVMEEATSVEYMEKVDGVVSMEEKALAKCMEEEASGLSRATRFFLSVELVVLGHHTVLLFDVAYVVRFKHMNVLSQSAFLYFPAIGYLQ